MRAPERLEDLVGFVAPLRRQPLLGLFHGHVVERGITGLDAVGELVQHRADEQRHVGGERRAFGIPWMFGQDLAIDHRPPVHAATRAGRGRRRIELPLRDQSGLDDALVRQLLQPG